MILKTAQWIPWREWSCTKDQLRLFHQHFGLIQKLLITKEILSNTKASKTGKCEFRAQSTIQTRTDVLNRDKPHIDTLFIWREFLEWVTRKDTKNKRTWWCFTAPHNPIMATKKRKNPTAMTAAITLKLETSPNHLPHAATPIIRRLTIWKQEKMDGYTLKSVHAQKRQLWI